GRPGTPAIPWEKPVPQAKCGPDDWNETGLQGQTSRYERESGLSELGFFCNLELVGQYQGEGAKYQMDWFGDCAYYGQRANPLLRHPGVVVVDAKFPQHPRPTTWLDTQTMQDPHEGLKVHQKRRLLAAVKNTTFGVGVAPGYALQPPSEFSIF